MPFRRGTYTLTPPRWPVFVVALVLTLLLALVHYKLLAIPAIAAHSYEVLLVGAILLIAGALFRGV